MADATFDRKRAAKPAAAAAPSLAPDSHQALEARALPGARPRAGAAPWGSDSDEMKD